MFRATMFLSSGELTVSMRHWYLSLCVGGCLICCSRPRQTWRKGLWLNLKTLRIYFFLCFLSVHPCIIFFKRSQLGAHYFLVYLFQLQYMFRATMCPSSGELTVSMRHWYFSLCVVGCLVCCSRPDSHPHILTTSLARANDDCNSNLALSPLFCCELVHVETEQRQNPPPTYSNKYY